MDLEYTGNGERYNKPILGKVVTGDVIRVSEDVGNILLQSPSKWKVKGEKKIGKKKMKLEEVTSEEIEDGSL